MLFLALMLSVWPLFVVCTVLLSMWAGEGSMLDVFQLEPKRLVAFDFIAGFKQSLPLALGLALLAIIDYLLLARLAGFRRLIGLLLLAGSLGITLWMLQGYPTAVVPVVISALVLTLLYRIALFVLRLTSLRNLGRRKRDVS